MEHKQPFTHAISGQGVSFTREERERHVYIVGKSGSGKSTALFNLAMQDIEDGEGVALIDPHGDLAEAVADCIPRNRTNEVCYFDAADTLQPVGFNPLAGIPPERQALAASGIVSAFKHLWGDSWGPRLEHFLYHGVATLIARSNATLIELPRLFTDDDFRERAILRVTDPITKAFWRGEFEKYDARFRTEAIAPILNKAGQFAASPNMRLILGQRNPKFDLAHAMNNRQIVIVNLAKGKIGEQAANLLGSLLISHLQLNTMERSHLPPENRVPFFVHVDEFQNFGTEAFAGLLAEARKFATHFCLANQFIEQLSPLVRASVLGNVGSLIVFRVSGADAEILSPEFHPLHPNALADLWPFTARLRRGSAGHDLMEVSPPLFSSRGSLGRVMQQSRRNFGRPSVTLGTRSA